MTTIRIKTIVAIAAGMILVSACGRSTTPAAPSVSSRASSVGASYHPKIDAANFTDKITNKYFPLVQGTTFEYVGTKDGIAETTTMTVKGTKVINGVLCTEVHDVVKAEGSIIEDTLDWYAQNKATGDVWYFGEKTAEYDHGKVTSTHGTWTYGTKGALPGIIMKADPVPNKTYRQEYLVGEAEDMATPLRADGSITVPYGSYKKNALVTIDFTPLEPDKIENKYYAAGVGFVYGQGIKNALEVKLAKVTHA